MNPTAWTAFCNERRNDRGAVETSFDLGNDALSNLAKSHTLDQNKLIDTITGSDKVNLLLVAGDQKDTLEWIHQGAGSFQTQLRWERAPRLHTWKAKQLPLQDVEPGDRC